MPLAFARRSFLGMSHCNFFVREAQFNDIPRGDTCTYRQQQLLDVGFGPGRPRYWQLYRLENRLECHGNRVGGAI